MGRSFEADLGVRTSPKLVWAVLTGFEHWLEWAPLVRDSQVLVRESGVSILEIELANPSMKVLVETVETGDSEIRFTEVGRYGEGAVRGYCRIQENLDRRGCRVGASVAAGRPFWSWRIRKEIRSYLPLFLEALRQRCEQLAFSAFASDPEERRLLLEVKEIAEGLEIRVGDRHYRIAEGGEA